MGSSTGGKIASLGIISLVYLIILDEGKVASQKINFSKSIFFLLT